MTDPRKPGMVLVKEEGGRFRESILLNSWGTGMLVLDSPSSLEKVNREDFPLRMLRKHYPLHSLIGVYRDVQLLEGKLALSRPHSINYYLMILHKKDFHRPEAMDGGGAGATTDGEARPAAMDGGGAGATTDGEARRARLTIHRATPRDLKKLLPLQSMYEREEVCLDPRRFSLRACQYQLKQTLGAQVIYYATLDGKAIVKGGTNALGYRTAQLGGIYTLPEHRNRKVATTLLHTLLTQLFTRLETSSLFVKTTNAAAIALYENLGFSIADRYRITYFNAGK